MDNNSNSRLQTSDITNPNSNPDPVSHCACVRCINIGSQSIARVAGSFSHLETAMRNCTCVVCDEIRVRYLDINDFIASQFEPLVPAWSCSRSDEPSPVLVWPEKIDFSRKTRRYILLDNETGTPVIFKIKCPHSLVARPNIGFLEPCKQVAVTVYNVWFNEMPVGTEKVITIQSIRYLGEPPTGRCQLEQLWKAVPPGEIATTKCTVTRTSASPSPPPSSPPIPTPSGFTRRSFRIKSEFGRHASSYASVGYHYYGAVKICAFVSFTIAFATFLLQLFIILTAKIHRFSGHLPCVADIIKDLCFQRATTWLYGKVATPTAVRSVVGFALVTAVTWLA